MYYGNYYIKLVSYLTPYPSFYTQNPCNHEHSIILIRSLVPGGVTHLSKKIFPGDRLVFVNRISLCEASLGAAVAALKSAPKGKVVLGILKSVPVNSAVGDVVTAGKLKMGMEI